MGSLRGEQLGSLLKMGGCLNPSSGAVEAARDPQQT